MKKPVLLIVGSLMVLAGVLWTLQGLGYVAGSPMTGVALWAILGPITAGLGVALLYVALRGGSAHENRR